MQLVPKEAMAKHPPQPTILPTLQAMVVGGDVLALEMAAEFEKKAVELSEKRQKEKKQLEHLQAQAEAEAAGGPGLEQTEYGPIRHAATERATPFGDKDPPPTAATTEAAASQPTTPATGAGQEGLKGNDKKEEKDEHMVDDTAALADGAASDRAKALEESRKEAVGKIDREIKLIKEQQQG
jgi:hypothetical protein